MVGPEEALPVGITIRRGLSGDAGEMLDAQGKLDYQRRLHELTQSLEDQRERGNHERVDQIESEIEFLTHAIVRARGIGGRQRRTGSNAERARLSVTSAIKTALEKISDQDRELGTFLDRFIRTGSFCRYVPPPETPVIWEFSAESVTTVPEIQKDGPRRPDRGRNFLRAFTAGTAFAGRNAESAMLMRALDQAERGSGKIVLIGGSAGVGKTRLAAEIADDATRRGMLTFVGGCYDREESVPLIPFVEILEAAFAQTRNLAAFRETLGSDASEIARLLPQLRRAFPDITAPVELPPEQSQQKLFSAVTELVTRVARSTPCLFLLDDLQWADKGSLLLLIHLAQFIPTMPVMVVGTFRDFDLDPAGPLNQTLDELIRRHLLERITLAGLPEESVGEMLRSLGEQEPPERVVRMFHAHTEGNPFFVEELFRHLVERGGLIDSTGAFRNDFEVGELDVPESLRVVIGRHLARLGDDTLKALGAAATIGRAFTFDLLAACVEMDADSTLNCLEEAEDAGLIASRFEYPDARFQFSHELVRRAVLSNLSAPRRQRLHLRVADAIQRLYPERLEDHVDDLAHHLWEAGTAAEIGKTIEYLRMASHRALLKGAYDTSASHLRNALELLNKLPPSASRESQELALQIALGAVLIAIKGFSSPEVEKVYSRARQLCQQAGEAPQLFPVLSGLWMFYTSRGEHIAARDLAEHCLRIAHTVGETGLFIHAHQILGVGFITTGDFVKANEHLEQVLEKYDAREHRSLVYTYGQDPAAFVLTLISWPLWFLGYPDRALRRCREAEALAQQLNHPYTSLSVAAFGTWLYQFTRNPQAVEALASQAISISTDHGFVFYRPYGLIMRGWAIVERGHVSEGIAQMRAGLDEYRTIGGGSIKPSFLSLLAEAYGKMGQFKQALNVLAEAQDLADKNEERWWQAELHRIKGELMLQHRDGHTASHNDQVAAEDCFHQALGVARSQRAKSLELRAAMSLCRLWTQQSRSSEAQGLLQKTLDTFEEGFETRDLTDAKLLMEVIMRS